MNLTRLDYCIFNVMIFFSLLGPTFGIPIKGSINITLFRVFLGILVVLVLYKLVNRKDDDLSFVFPIRRIGLFFGVWMIYALVALSWSFSVSAGIVYSVKLGSMLLLCFSLPYFLRDERSFWRTQKVLLYVCGFIILFGVVESFLPQVHLPTSRVFGKVSTVVTSVFHNENDLASFITLAIPFLITAIFMLKMKFRYKVCVYLITTMAIYTLLATGSRSNTVFALPLVFLVLIFVVPSAIQREKLTKRNLLRGVALFVSSIILINVMSTMYLSPGAREGRVKAQKLWNTAGLFSDMLEEGNDEILPGEQGKSGKVRKNLIINGLRFLHNSYYLGVGPGNIEPMMKRHGVKVDKSNMHNWWVEVFVNFGIIIFTLYMVMYFWVLWKLYTILRLKISPHVSPLLRWGAVSTLASLSGFFFGGIAPSTAIHFTPMWISLGVGLTIIALANRHKANGNGT